jgi:hypothetical protein
VWALIASIRLWLRERRRHGSFGLFEAGCDTAELFKCCEAAFREVALGIEMLDERAFERA